MVTDKSTTFEVLVSGKQSSAIDAWHQISLIVHSGWESGSDEEKFEVLTAIRKTYDPKNNADIRGNEHHTPAQVGRAQGFRELWYRRAVPASLQIIIVPRTVRHLRLVSRAEIQGEASSVARIYH